MSKSLARRALVTSLVVGLVAALALPSVSKPGKSQGKKKGKSAIGTVTAFDATTLALSVEFKDASTFEGTLSPDSKIKLEHRGRPKVPGNPTKGSIEDVEVGDKVLKMKARQGEVVKIWLRDVNSDVQDANGGECKPVAPAETELESDAKEEDRPSCADRVNADDDDDSDDSEPDSVEEESVESEDSVSEESLDDDSTEGTAPTT